MSGRQHLPTRSARDVPNAWGKECDCPRGSAGALFGQVWRANHTRAPRFEILMHVAALVWRREDEGEPIAIDLAIGYPSGHSHGSRNPRQRQNEGHLRTDLQGCFGFRCESIFAEVDAARVEETR